MRVGIPREVKQGEFRVALTPAAVGSLEDVIVEPGAGAGVGFGDAEYLAAGAKLGDPWECELVVKVKELQEAEFAKPRRGQTVLAFDQFAARPELLAAALASGAAYLSYNTVGRQRGESPILAPMSAIAGRLAVQVGAWCLQKQNGGSGVLLSGFDDVPPARVAILGAGNVGSNALAAACGMGASVSVFARTEKRFADLRARYPKAEFQTGDPAEAIRESDLVIGGVFTPGAASPKIVTRAMLRAMRPGSALVDVGIDQGGIAETSRPTSHSEPIYLEEGIVHHCVPNLPAACPRTASLALERAVLPYVRILAKGEMNEDLEAGLRVRDGRMLR
ncbi:MAG: alanine dehydrogenase [Betaproteobacteria bacterium]